MRARSRLIAALTALTCAAALFAACSDSTPTGVESRELAASPPQSGATASGSVSPAPRMLVYGTYAGADSLTKYVQMAIGVPVTREETSDLPADLTPYKAIWYVDPFTPISENDRARLVAFVQGGGGLYVSGENDSCCFPLNVSIHALLAAIVKGGANIQVGGLGTGQSPIDQYEFNPGVVPGLFGPWEPGGPGGMLNIPFQNVLASSPWTMTAPTAGGWDAPALVGEFGRLVVMMDVNWLGTVGSSGANSVAMIKVAQFLLNAPKPNAAPTASAGGPYTGIEGTPVIFSAAGSSDADFDPLTVTWDLDGDGAYDDATGSTASKMFGDNGIYTVRVRVSDSRLTSTAAATVTINNSKPTLSTFSAPSSVVEGTAITLSASGATDVPADQASLVIRYSCDGGTSFGAIASCAAVDGPAAVDVVARVSDKDGGFSDYTASVAVTNAAPAIVGLTLPVIPVSLGAPVSLSASFSDAWVSDGHTAWIDWDDASSSSGNVSGASNPRAVAASHTYATPGVYSVTLSVSDDAGESTVATHQYVVVYDPSAGFVTGGGWIAYGATACPVLCGAAAGRGDFGFVSKYAKGATVPTGDTRFEFHAGTLKFESTSYEWLVVAGSRAQYKGRGTIGGGGDYGFLVTAVDGATDAFRIKIWDRTTSAIVFDNQMGADDVSSTATLLDKVSGNGSIVIRTK